MTAITLQLVNELQDRLSCAVLIGRLDDVDAAAVRCAPGIVGDLLCPVSSGDTARNILWALWGTNTTPADHGRPEWWATPLGQACARALVGRDDDATLTHADAAAILGVARTSITSLINRGHLIRHESGRVLRSSVVARLANTSPVG